MSVKINLRQGMKQIALNFGILMSGILDTLSVVSLTFYILKERN
jgi:hypothetical protein